MLATTYSLHTVLSEDIKEAGRTQASIAEELGVSKPTLSQVLKGDKSISLQLLDGITSALQRPCGHYYHLYMEECFSGDGKRPRKPKKLEKYILHCLEKGLDLQASEAISKMLEDGGYLANIFDIGEELYTKGLLEKAFDYFGLVTKHERDRTAIHLAMAYYRQLKIIRNQNTELACEIAIRLSDYLDFVKEDEMLEAYYKVISVFRLNYKWDHILTYGKKMLSLSYKENRLEYAGDALIKLAIAAREKGDINGAIQYHDECMKIPVGNYRIWAEGNKYITLIRAGDITGVRKLFDFCLLHREISYEGLEVILDAAVSYDLQEIIQEFFVEFADQIKVIEQERNKEAVLQRGYINLILAKSIWQLKNGRFQGVKDAMEAVELAMKLRLKKQAINGLKIVLQHANKSSMEFQKCLELLEKIA
ncbi:helix-turn-helix transcriptional regulator [Brevibacillus sp. AG]|uniref:helix-turn-helix domain-containing protein n=1 Tax=Brevibacillus sp. AG TaxID=3020891 RepID=UPI00233021A9|nr:helix-turn-helix transcriptional regulator [Brevibacillus sp. AG]MDC0763469.1 helix-turn-helix transcriptional regulator [Brevibacillus sp. AG]